MLIVTSLQFLFAVVRDVQRNKVLAAGETFTSGFYSLSCETYSGTAHPQVHRQRWQFLFAVVRDVQRNLAGAVPVVCVERVSIRCRARRTAEPTRVTRRPSSITRFYSLSCETYSGTGSLAAVAVAGTVSIRCRARRTAELVQDRDRLCQDRRVSIRCRARRTAEPLVDSADAVLAGPFLFAVVRDVQRNSTSPNPAH